MAIGSTEITDEIALAKTDRRTTVEDAFKHEILGEEKKADRDFIRTRYLSAGIFVFSNYNTYDDSEKEQVINCLKSADVDNKNC